MKAPVFSSDNDDDVAESDSLEYDENASNDESDGNESDYQMSQDESDVVEHSEGDEDEDAIMLDVAIRDSLQSIHSTEGSNAGAGPSKSSNDFRASRAQRLARAAEQRLQKQAVDNPSDSVDASDSSDDALVHPTKVKKPAVKRKISNTKKASDSRVSTLRDLREARREKRRQAQQNRREELALRKKLGRRLTPARPRPLVENTHAYVYIFQAEKSTIALHKHHPELVDVWGDLERAIPVPTPQKATPPSRLKATLLPFQLESLHWMREQERSIWCGGLLAVCIFLSFV